MYKAALTVKIVKSKKRLFDYAFGDSKRESTAQVRLQRTEAGYIGPQNVGDNANVRTMATSFAYRIIEMKAVSVARVSRVGSFDGPKRVHLA